MSAEALIEKVKDYIASSDGAKQSLERFLDEQESTREDWWHSTPQVIKDLLLQSRAESERGEDISHEEMKKRYPQWFKR